jgi:dienelactone hydrolase
VDPARLGAAGYSLGAHTVSHAQGFDARIKAIVAWDNLASSSGGDEGSAKCFADPPATPVVPRVPSMGQGSESCAAAGRDAKAAAFDRWREAGVPSMELVFAGTNHFAWSQRRAEDGPGIGGNESGLRLFAHFTRAWFDRYLRDEPGVDALLGADVLGRPQDEVLSPRFRSGAFLPEAAVDCPDLAAC